MVADALSCIPELPPNTLLSFSVPCLTFLEELKQHLASNHAFNALGQAISTMPTEHQDYSLANNLIMHHGRIWLPLASPFTQTQLKEYHSSPIGGHFGISKTLARIRENFTWPGIRNDAEKFVASCVDCQHAKYETKRVVGLLCPLPVPF